MSAAAILLEEEATTTVSITVPFDVHHAPDLRHQLIAAIRQGSGPLVLDLSGTTVRDSTGFATLLSSRVRASHAGRALRFSGADARTRRLLWRSRMGRLLVD